MAIVVGERVKVVECYLDVFSCAPLEHLTLLQRRGTKIVFAPTIPIGIRSAAAYRNRRLSDHEYWDIQKNYSERTGTVGVYDGILNAIVLPTHYVTDEIERAVMHELGHAMTSREAEPRASLLRGLPREIAENVMIVASDDRPEASSLLVQVREALADAYAFFALGRGEELPHDLLSELSFILSTVCEGQSMRLDLLPE